MKRYLSSFRVSDLIIPTFSILVTIVLTKHFTAKKIWADIALSNAERAKNVAEEAPSWAEIPGGVILPGKTHEGDVIIYQEGTSTQVKFRQKKHWVTVDIDRLPLESLEYYNAMMAGSGMWWKPTNEDLTISSIDRFCDHYLVIPRTIKPFKPTKYERTPLKEH